eukprot:scaffold322_cov88-Cylindrotheca_fusiformis.AAC.4
MTHAHQKHIFTTRITEDSQVLVISIETMTSYHPVSTSLIFLFAFLLLLITTSPTDSSSSSLSSSSEREHEDTTTTTTTDVVHLEPWQQCNIFLAPSLLSSPSRKNMMMGWGVFAGRSFEKDEIVDMAPLILPMVQGAPQVVNSILDEYAYGYRRIHFDPKKTTMDYMLGVFLGMTMFYNHHPSSHNVQYTTFGREPAPDVPNASNAVGFRARRAIQAGEELFSYYQAGGGGGGGSETEKTDEWFRVRRIPLMDPSDNLNNNNNNNNARYNVSTTTTNPYCSKMISGIGRPTWEDRILPMLPPRNVVGFFLKNSDLLPPWDVGLGNARAKVFIPSGERIEVAIGLLMSKSKQIDGTILAPIAFSYSKDMLQQHQDPQNQQVLERLVQQNKIQLQYQGKDTDWERINLLLDDSNGNAVVGRLEDIAIFPAAGNIGMVRRVGGGGDGVGKNPQNANCKLVISESLTNNILMMEEESNNNDSSPISPSASVVLELIATQDIHTGDVLLLDLPRGGTKLERQLLKMELDRTGLPYQDGFFNDDDNDNPKYHHQPSHHHHHPQKNDDL